MLPCASNSHPTIVGGLPEEHPFDLKRRPIITTYCDSFPTYWLNDICCAYLSNASRQTESQYCHFIASQPIIIHLFLWATPYQLIEYTYIYYYYYFLVCASVARIEPRARLTIECRAFALLIFIARVQNYGSAQIDGVNEELFFIIYHHIEWWTKLCQ